MREGALEVRVGEQIENLEEDIRGTDGRAFFAGTYVTRGLEELVRKAVARLAGQSSCAGVVLKQALGGGKTHLMKCAALLAADPELRREVMPGVPHINDFGAARVAAFNGRNRPPGFFWGEIARQLGYEDTEHFSRRFRAQFGLSPMAYRKEAPAGPGKG